MAAKMSTKQCVGERFSMRAMSWLTCKFKSTIKTRLPFKLKAHAILTVMKVLPTPPLLLNTEIILQAIVFYFITIFDFVADRFDYYRLG